MTNTDNYPSLWEKVEDKKVKSLKPGKSPGVDNIPAELIQAGGETIINALQQDLADRRMAYFLDSVTGNYSSKERRPAKVSELLHN